MYFQAQGIVAVAPTLLIVGDILLAARFDVAVFFMVVVFAVFGFVLARGCGTYSLVVGTFSFSSAVETTFCFRLLRLRLVTPRASVSSSGVGMTSIVAVEITNCRLL